MSEAPVEPAVETIELGPILLTSAPGWRFYPMRERVIGRPANGVGAIHIVCLPLSTVTWPATHEACMSAAIEASQKDIEGSGFDRAKELNDCCLAGGESFRVGKNYYRVWYRHCTDGMIAAWFACKQMRVKERAVVDNLRAADRMISTVRVKPPMA
jgi:hypothetical protein